MTPDQIQALVAIATILKSIGTMPVGIALVFLLIGPWVAMLIASGASDRRMSKANERFNKTITDQNKRASEAIATQNERVDKAIESQNERINKTAQEFREQVQAMVTAQEKRFEQVVRMYENNVQVVKDYHSLSSDLTGIITLSTRTLEGLVQKIDNNQFCPLAREGVGKG